MSEYKCAEPGCDYHVGISNGPNLTPEDWESEDYYFQEIEDHEQMHAEQRWEVQERTTYVVAEELKPCHFGSLISILGQDTELRGVHMQASDSRYNVKLDLVRWRTGSPLNLPVSEHLFWDVPGRTVLELRSRAAKPASRVVAKRRWWDRLKGWAGQLWR